MSETTERQWKVGDELAFSGSSLHGGPYIARIEAITRSGLLKCCQSLINPKTMRVSGAFDLPNITVSPVTDEIWKQVRRNKAIRFVSGTLWKTLTDDQLARIIAIVKEGAQS